MMIMMMCAGRPWAAVSVNWSAQWRDLSRLVTVKCLQSIGWQLSVFTTTVNLLWQVTNSTLILSILCLD